MVEHGALLETTAVTTGAEISHGCTIGNRCVSDVSVMSVPYHLLCVFHPCGESKCSSSSLDGIPLTLTGETCGLHVGVTGTL